MSLVVATATPTSLLAVADSKVTAAMRRTNPYLESVSKLTILDDRRFVAFAGSVDPAVQALSLVGSTSSNEKLLLDLATRSRDCDVEFLCGFLDPSPHLVHVERGIMTNSQRHWIGDHEAFRQYQKYALGVEQADRATIESTWMRILKVPQKIDGSGDIDAQTYCEMFASMEAVINAGTVTSVGGAIIPVITTQGALRYGSYLCTFRSEIGASELRDGWTVVNWGDASTGSFAVAFGPLTSRSFAVYIPQINLGLIYNNYELSGVDGFVPEVHDRVDEIDFDDYLKQRFGRGLCLHMHHSPAHFLAKAEHLLKHGDVERSAVLLTRGIMASSRTWKGLPERPTFKYESLKACADAEGLPLQIPTDQVDLLRRAFFLRGFANAKLSSLDAAARDLKEAMTLGANFPGLHELMQQVERARAELNGGSSGG